MAQSGANVPRRDGVGKVTGSARYVDDIRLPGMWFGAVVRSKRPHAKISKIEFDESFDWSRVVIATAADIPGKNCVAIIEEDMPLLADSVTKHIGEGIALVAAPTRELAEEARQMVRVTYEDLPVVLSIDDSKSAATKIRNDDNVMSHFTISKGNIEKGFAQADQIVEGVYAVGHQEHMYIEPNGIIASPREGGGFDVIGSMQCPYYISKSVSVMMGMPEEKFSIRQATVGGAFGGKEDYPSLLAGYCLLLARKAGRPIKMVYDRAEDTEVTTKRHPARIRHKTGVKKNGKITAMEITVEMDAGAYLTLTPVVLSRGIIHAAGPYRCDNISIVGTAYATNMTPNGAFRGFGVPQTCFACEAHMDLVAEKLGISPVELRKKNYLKEGDLTATGQKLDSSIACEDVLMQALEKSGIEKQISINSKQSGNVRKGVGISLFFHGAAFTGSGEAKIKAKAGLRVEADGRLAVLTACTEMGQGSHTVIPQMAADFLGIDLDLISIETPDTSLVPNSGPTVASRTTMIMGMVMKKCAASVKSSIIEFVSKKLGVAASDLEFSGDQIVFGDENVMRIKDAVSAYHEEFGPREFIEMYDLPPGISWDEKRHLGDAYPTYSWACDVAEVEVDMSTFEIKVDRMWLFHDVGKAINPSMVEGQIEGGTLQALGYAILENHLVKDGRFVTNRFQNYIIPTALDVPEFKTFIVEKPYEHGPVGAKGIGEMPMDGAAPAIVNAIADATGIRITELPVTPEKLYDAWHRKQGICDWRFCGGEGVEKNFCK